MICLTADGYIVVLVFTTSMMPPLLILHDSLPTYLLAFRRLFRITHSISYIS